MHYCLSLIITLLVATSAIQAASSSKTMIEIPKFKTQARIPRLKYQLAGFLVGSFQQGATVALMDNYMQVEQYSLGLYFQWMLCVGSSICVRAEFDANVRDLAAHNKTCARMIFDKLHPEGTYADPEEGGRMFRKHDFVETFKEKTKHTADVYNAYNALLVRNVKWRSFCEGYIAATILGPIPAFVGSAALLMLGGMPH
jgi:hypothetical protein